MEGVKFTPQRVAVLEEIIKDLGHRECEEIYLAIKQDKINVSRANELKSFSHGQRIRIAGHVIVRQKPRTAKGFVFISLEDETGISNVIITPNLYNNQRILFHQEKFLLSEGTLQNQERVISIKAEVVHPLQVTTAKTQSHDFY